MRGSRLIQGCKLSGSNLIFSSYHFTNESSANLIFNWKELLIKNIIDPYIYLLEILDYSNASEQEIRHSIGSKSASHLIRIKISYPIEKIWIKVEKNRPTHFA